MLILRKAETTAETVTVGAHLRSMGQDSIIIIPYQAARHRVVPDALPDVPLVPPAPILLLDITEVTPASDANA